MFSSLLKQSTNRYVLDGDPLQHIINFSYSLVKTKKPTGVGKCPPHVTRAHEIENLINERAGDDDIEEVSPPQRARILTAIARHHPRILTLPTQTYTEATPDLIATTIHLPLTIITPVQVTIHLHQKHTGPMAPSDLQCVAATAVLSMVRVSIL